MHQHTASHPHVGEHAGTDPVSTTGNVIHWATRYDWLVQSMTLGRAGLLRKRMAALLPLQPGNVVLDIGCGTGDLAFRLARRVGAMGKVIGVDPSPEMIERARMKAQRRKLAIDFRVEPAEALTLADASVDYVVSSLVFHHLPGELKSQALAAVARVLKPGGQLVIIDFMDAASHVLTHAAHPADPHNMTTLLRAAGLEPVRTGRIPFFAPRLPPLGFVTAQRAAP